MTAKSNKRQITIEGREFDSIQSAASAFGLSRNTVDYRLSKGWTPEEAVGLRPRPNHAGRTPGIPVKVQGREFTNIKEAAELCLESMEEEGWTLLREYTLDQVEVGV